MLYTFSPRLDQHVCYMGSHTTRTADTFAARLLHTLSLRCLAKKIKVFTIRKKIITLMAGVEKVSTLQVIKILTYVSLSVNAYSFCQSLETTSKNSHQFRNTTNLRHKYHCRVPNADMFGYRKACTKQECHTEMCLKISNKITLNGDRVLRLSAYYL